MDVTNLEIQGSFVIAPKIHSDDRGEFWEFYRYEELSAVIGHALTLRQANASISKRGAFRGIHFAELRPGQAKYVTCTSGEILDLVVDLRVGSPTFGLTESILLSDQNRRSVYLSEGLGHGFIALSDNAVVNYLVSGVYNPNKEHGINPLRSGLKYEVPSHLELLLSPKDLDAPSLEEAQALGILPTWQDSLERYQELVEEEAK